MCTTLEFQDGSEIGELGELKEFLGGVGVIVEWPNAEQYVELDDTCCLCQIDLDATLKKNSVPHELDESCMYYRIDLPTWAPTATT